MKLREEGLPVGGDSAEPLVCMLPLKEQAIAVWRKLVDECDGKAPPTGMVKERVRKLKGETGKDRKIGADEVIKTCTELLEEMPADTEKAIAMRVKVERLHAYATAKKKESTKKKKSRKKEEN